MNGRFFLLIGILLLTGCRPKPGPTPILILKQVNDSIYSIDYHDHYIEINANVSGRIISYQLAGEELLVPREVHNENYGSTLWPAPQTEWHWPPPAQLDGDPYTAVISEEGIYMESKKDSLTGLQFGKQFDFNQSDTSFSITYIVKNLNDTARYAAPWEVTRVKGGLSFFPLGEGPIMDKSNLKPVSVEGDIVWYNYDRDALDRSQKMFSSGSEGWLAHAVDKLLFVKKFPDIHPLKTAPGQGEVEIFAHYQYPYIELENHGKYTLLEPNEFLEWRVKWYIRELSWKTLKKRGNQKLVEKVRRLIENTKQTRPL